MCILSQAGNNINHLDMQWWGVQSNQASENNNNKKGIKKPTLLAQKRPKPFSV